MPEENPLCGPVIFFPCTNNKASFYCNTKEGSKSLRSALNKPWNTIVGLANPNQMRSFTWNYVSARRRAFKSSVASFFVTLANRCACGHPHSFRLCAGSEFGSGRPDESISVRRHWVSLTHVMVKGRKVPGDCKKTETHSAHASTVLLAVNKRSSSRP